MVGSGIKAGGRTRAILAARVAGMDVVRSASPARVLPEATALIPVKAKAPKDIGGGTVTAGGKIQPNPTSNDFSQFKLGGQLGLKQAQDRLRGQFPVGEAGGKGAGF